MSFIGKTLQQAVVADRNIEFIGFFTPSGFQLGGVYADGRFEAGGQINPSNLVSERGGESFTLVKKVLASNSSCCECRTKNIVGAGEPYFYYLKAKVTLMPIKNAQRTVLLKACALFLFLMAVASVVSKLLAQRLVKRIQKVELFLEEVSELDYDSRRMPIEGNDEIANLTTHLNKMMDRLSVAQEKLLESAKMQEYNRIAHQVAHDIRSPLAALSVATQDLRELPEEQRILIRSAVQRIDDIANDLASKKKVEGADTEQEQHTVYHLSGLIESLVSEKRVQYRNRSGLNIEFKPNKDSYGVFAKIKAKEFKRVLSNIINNSVEAMDSSGNIAISMGVSAGHASLILSDNGKGIPVDVLPKLMQRGATFGKEGHASSGSGLGLYHARDAILSFNGDMQIKSEVGKGTDVIITLPITPAPNWFLPEIKITPQTRVVILDDDESIHQIWNNRYATVGIKGTDITHFKTAEDLAQWYGEIGASAATGNHLYLCDYEILGSDKTGLQVIEELNLKGAVLITSHFEERDIRKRCEGLGIKLIPKNLAGYVPIRVIEKSMAPTANTIKNDAEYILIDDDALNRKSWEIMAKMKKKRIKTFGHPNLFFEQIECFDKQTKIYIDSSLGDDLKGEVVAQDIYNRGFETIYLATGYKKEDFTTMPWIKDIVGKGPPFVG